MIPGGWGGGGVLSLYLKKSLTLTPINKCLGQKWGKPLDSRRPKCIKVYFFSRFGCSIHSLCYVKWPNCAHWSFSNKPLHNDNIFKVPRVAVVHRFDCTVEPVLTATSALQPPVYNGQHYPQLVKQFLKTMSETRIFVTKTRPRREVSTSIETENETIREKKE